MAAEGAVHRHQAVAEQPFTGALMGLPQHAGHGAAGNACRQRDVLWRRVGRIAFDKRAMPQVVDAGTAHPADPPQGRRVGAGAEHGIDEVSAALQG
jgi:hypothetical protein